MTDRWRRPASISICPFLDLWIAYFALGGVGDAPTLGAYLRGEARPSASDHDMIAHALNEMFAERDEDSPVPYTGDCVRNGRVGGQRPPASCAY